MPRFRTEAESELASGNLLRQATDVINQQSREQNLRLQQAGASRGLSPQQLARLFNEAESQRQTGLLRAVSQANQFRAMQNIQSAEREAQRQFQSEEAEASFERGASERESSRRSGLIGAIASGIIDPIAEEFTGGSEADELLRIIAATQALGSEGFSEFTSGLEGGDGASFSVEELLNFILENPEAIRGRTGG